MSSNNIVNSYSTTIITIFQDVIKNYEKSLEIIKQTEEELNDLNHEIEFGQPKNAYQGYLLYKEVRELRIKRRQAKEEVELLHSMYEYLTGQTAQAFKNKIQSIQGEAVKLRQVQETRIYRPRQRNDLTISDHVATANKPFEQLLSDFNKNKPYMQGGKMRK